MLTPLRRELLALLAKTDACRPPALRRSSHPEALLATDLPLLVAEEAAAAFIRAAEARGWRVWAEGGWLLLDHPVEAPPLLPRRLTGEAA